MTSRSVLQWGPRWRRAAVLAIAGGTPLLFLRVTFDPINIPKLALVIAGCGFVLGIRLAEVGHGADLRVGRELWFPALALTMPLVLAWVFSPYKAWALWGNYPRYLGLLPYVVVTVFGLLAVDAFKGETSSLGWALIIAGGTAGAYAILQFLGFDPFTWSVKGEEAERVVASTLGNPNFVGAFLAIALPVGAGLVLAQPDLRRYVVPLLGLAAVGWMLARSEGAWAAGAAGLCSMAGIIVSRNRPKARVAGSIIAALIALSSVGVVVLGVVRPDSVPPTIARRGDWWQGAAKMVGASPIVGRGPSAYAVEGVQHRTVQDAQAVNFDFTDDPHSIVLSFSTGAGVLGLAGVAVGLSWVVHRAVSAPADGISAGFAGGIVAYVVQALISIDTVTLRVAFWVCVAGLVGAALAPSSSIPARRKDLRRARAREGAFAAGLAWAGGVVAILTGYVALNLVLADGRFQQGTLLYAQGRPDLGQIEFDGARAFHDDAFYRRTNGRLAGEVAGLVGERARRFHEISEEAFSYLVDLPQPNGMVDQARALAAWGEVDPASRQRALDLYLDASELDQYNPLLLHETATFALELGWVSSHQAAIDLLEPKVEPLRDPSLWGALALARARVGMKDSAADAARTALALDPTNSQAQQALTIIQEMDASG